MNLNKVFILGRLTADPQLRAIATGTSVASFSVATNRVRMDKSGKRQDETEFHNIVTWGRQAEIANQFLTKGAMVLIEGRLQTRSWTDKQGQTRRTTEIVCERLQLGPRAANQGGGASSSSWNASGKSAGPAAAGDGMDQTAGATNQKDASSMTQEIQEEDIPIIDVDEDDGIKPEELPF